MVSQKGFRVDLSRCIGCRACDLACQTDHGLKGIHRRNVTPLKDPEEGLFGFLSMSCNHCANPACISVCPNHCFTKRRDGIVTYDPDCCHGCQLCMAACPFGAPKFMPEIGKITKCDFCVELTSQGQQPICVQSCVTGALQAVELSTLDESRVSKMVPKVQMAQYTHPSIRFVLPQKGETYFINDHPEGEA